jgi:hypothetical protein
VLLEKEIPYEIRMLVRTDMHEWHRVCYAADSEDGNSLLRNCRAAVRALDGEKLDINESTKADLCMGYIAGVADLDATWRSEDKEDKSKNFPLHICLPEGGEVRLGQCAPDSC